eukprot:2521617-Pyramimonas_sp.AAC.1
MGPPVPVMARKHTTPQRPVPFSPRPVSSSLRLPRHRRTLYLRTRSLLDPDIASQIRQTPLDVRGAPGLQPLPAAAEQREHLPRPRQYWAVKLHLEVVHCQHQPAYQLPQHPQRPAEARKSVLSAGGKDRRGHEALTTKPFHPYHGRVRPSFP